MHLKEWTVFQFLGKARQLRDPGGLWRGVRADAGEPGPKGPAGQPQAADAGQSALARQAELLDEGSVLWKVVISRHDRHDRIPPGYRRVRGWSPPGLSVGPGTVVMLGAPSAGGFGVVGCRHGVGGGLVAVAGGVGVVGVGGGLEGEQFGVDAGCGDELVVVAVFDDAAAVEDVDVVGVADGVVAV